MSRDIVNNEPSGRRDLWRGRHNSVSVLLTLTILSQRWMFKNAKNKNPGENLNNKKKSAV